MTPNFAHNIVHSSAMYYQNLIMIHECSKKLLKMKNSKSFFEHLVHVYTHRFKPWKYFLLKPTP